MGQVALAQQYSKHTHTLNNMLWYPFSPVVALGFVTSVRSSYLAGVIACQDEDYLAPSFRRHLASKQATNRGNYIFQASVKHLV